MAMIFLGNQSEIAEKVFRKVSLSLGIKSAGLCYSSSSLSIWFASSFSAVFSHLFSSIDNPATTFYACAGYFTHPA
jgi:hypothetical protein